MTNNEEESEIQEYRRKLYEEFKANITLNGYRQLSTEKGWRKLSWALIMAFLTTFAVYLSYHMLRDFGHQTIIVHEDDDGLSHVDYPTITICTNNPVYSPTSLKKFPLRITLEQYLNFYVENLSSESYHYNTSDASKEVLKALYASNITTYKEMLQLFENSIDNSMDAWSHFMKGAACYLGDQPCNLATDFRETLIWKYSLCHQWNYYDHKKTSKRQTTDDETLTLLLDIHSNHKLVGNYFPFHGIALYIHPYGTPHHLAQHTESMGIQTGKYTTIDIELTEINLLPTPYSTRCSSKKLNIIKNFPYSRALCEIDCILVKIYNKCKCIGFEFEGQIGDLPICSVEQMKCYYKYLNTYKGTCGQYAATCPRECTYYKYHFQSSLIMDLGDEIMYHGFMAGWDKDRKETEKYIRQNLLVFEIGYKGMSMRKEQYHPSVTFSALIGTVGGSIGLCLGFSLVTVYEVLFFIYDYATARWKVDAKKRKEEMTTTVNVRPRLIFEIERGSR